MPEKCTIDFLWRIEGKWSFTLEKEAFISRSQRKRRNSRIFINALFQEEKDVDADAEVQQEMETKVDEESNNDDEKLVDSVTHIDEVRLYGDGFAIFTDRIYS